MNVDIPQGVPRAENVRETVVMSMKKGTMPFALGAALAATTAYAMACGSFCPGPRTSFTAPAGKLTYLEFGTYNSRWQPHYEIVKLGDCSGKIEARLRTIKSFATYGADVEGPAGTACRLRATISVGGKPLVDVYTVTFR